MELEIAIIYEYPPNFDAVLKVFPEAQGRDVIFAYNRAIYNPHRVDISPSLIAHERVHLERQGSSVVEVEEWWHKYLTDVQFRFHEELLAHRAEYFHIASTASRPVRRRTVKEIAKRLSGPLYGNMISKDRAKNMILEGWDE